MWGGDQRGTLRSEPLPAPAPLTIELFIPDDAHRQRFGELTARVHVVAGAGHFPDFEEPDEYAQVVGDFIRSHAGAPGA